MDSGTDTDATRKKNGVKVTFSSRPKRDVEIDCCQSTHEESMKTKGNTKNKDATHLPSTMQDDHEIDSIDEVRGRM